jgi:hypothetical protein
LRTLLKKKRPLCSNTNGRKRELDTMISNATGAPAPPANKRDHALIAARRGLPVFKLPSNAKKPPLSKAFYAVATTDPVKVSERWTEPVSGDACDNNIGVATDNRLVIDVDVKDGKAGKQSLQRLIDRGLDVSTLTSRTPSGGSHLYYSLPPGVQVKDSTDKLGPGLDVRGYHGYVVAPGSTIDGCEYRWVNPDAPILPAPDWLIAEVGAVKPKTPRDINLTPLVELDQPTAVDAAIDYLVKTAPEAIEGSGGNTTTYKIACAVRDRGISETMCLELMLEYWNPEKAVPPWDVAELEVIIANAYRYAQEPVEGAKSPEAEFVDEVERNDRQVAAEPDVIDDIRPWWRDPTEIPPREVLYGRHYIRKSIGASIGAGGRMKTTHSLFEAVEAAVGRDLTTNEPLPSGPLHVLCLNAEEDQDELDRRVAAICQRYKIDEDALGGRLFVKSVREKPLRLATTVQGVATLNQSALDTLATYITRNGIDIFMLDPWISFHAVNESSNPDMDLVIKEGLGTVATRTNSAGEIFHHPGKPKPGQAETTVEDGRGASAILWAVRSARVFNFMSPEEAAKLGISEDHRRRHIRITNGKANMGPIGKAEWIQIEVEKLPNGDEVAFSSRWQPPDPFEGVSSDHVETVRQLVRTGEYRADTRSPEWVGYAIAKALDIPVCYGADNDPKDMARLRAIVQKWLKINILKIETRRDGNRRERKFIVIDQGVSECGTTAADIFPIDDGGLLQ